MDLGRVIGVDYGRKHIGIALSDPERIIAMPLRVLNVENPEHGVAQVASLVKDYEAAALVVGLPRSLSGEDGTMAHEVRAWADRLRVRCKIPIHLVDERMSTVEAEQVRRETRRKGRTDHVAAALILRVFLEESR